MAYASKAGRARTSASRPQAFAVCDRCGIWHNHYQLRFQFDWAGTTLVNKRILVCGRCIDKPQEQLRAIVLPADPVPIQNPRPEYALGAYNTDYRITDSAATDTYRHGIPIPHGDVRTTQGGDSRTLQAALNTPTGYGVARVVNDQTVGERVTDDDAELRITEWQRRV
jgi:hypothetical protein